VTVEAPRLRYATRPTTGTTGRLPKVGARAFSLLFLPDRVEGVEGGALLERLRLAELVNRVPGGYRNATATGCDAVFDHAACAPFCAPSRSLDRENA